MADKGDVTVTLNMIATAGASSRRHSMGWINSSSSGEKVVPHHLRASTGSCHDFCKYGRNHTFETKSRQSVPKNVSRRSLDGGSSVDCMVLLEKKKTGGSWVDCVAIPERKNTTTTHMPKSVARKSLDSGCLVDSMVLTERKQTSLTRIPENVARKSLDSGSLVDNAVHLERKKTTSACISKSVARKSRDSGNSVDSAVLCERKKTTSTRGKAEFLSTSRMSEANVTTRPKLLEESSGFPSPLQREVLNERKKFLAVPKTLPKSGSHTENLLKNLKPKTSSATRNPEDPVVQDVAKAKESKLPEKSNQISKSKSNKVKPLSSAVSPSNSRRKNDLKTGINSGTSKVAAKKVTAISTCSSSAILTARKRINLKGVPLKTHNKLEMSKEVEETTLRSEAVQEESFESQSEEVKEKTLYVIKIESEEIPHQSDQNKPDDHMEPLPSSLPNSLSLPTSPYISDEVEHKDVSKNTESEGEDDSYSESDEISSNETDNLSSEGGKEGRCQNLGTLQENDPQSTKLRFRRGKIIDVHPESNSPRRLNFRRGRLLGESQRDVDGSRKNFKRGKEVDSVVATAKETVVLRHQDVQGKKDAQGLFNNVIEETASKLVETRKSKVKALVGAFETVISLQDGKPSVGS